MTTLRILATLTVLALPAAAQKGTFVITKGKDTVAVESFSRDGGTLRQRPIHGRHQRDGTGV